MSERSDVVPVPEGEYVEANRFAGFVVAAGCGWSGQSGALRRGRLRRSAPVQFLVAICLCLFLHDPGGLFFLDHCPSRDGRGVVGRRAAPTGKPGHAHCR